jgi:hypothetical protein
MDRDRKEARPPHAAEGAYAAIPLLNEAADGHDSFLTAALTAITRHHGAFTNQLTTFRLISDAQTTVAATLELPPERVPLMDSPTRSHCADFGDYLLRATEIEHAPVLPLYFYLARRLRLADQNSFAEA